MRLMKYLIWIALLQFCIQGYAQPDSLNRNLDKLFPLADKDELFGLERNTKNPDRLDQEYFFNKKIHFQLKWNSYVHTGYFYINTKTGVSLMDKNFFHQLGDRNSTDFHLTFPEYKEYFLYFYDPRDGKKYSRISHTSLPIGPSFLEDPEELLTFFKDWFSGPGRDIAFLGDKSDLKSESYTTMWEENDATLYLSKQTGTVITNNYCVGWLGLGYLNRNNDHTEIITRLQSVSAQYQVDLLREENVNYTFNGKLYVSIQAKMNEAIATIELSERTDKGKKQEKIAKINDATEAELESKLLSAKEKKMNKAKTLGKQLADDHGKVTDFYDAMSKANDPIDDVDIFEAELNLKIYKTDKKLLKETSAKKKEKLMQEKIAMQKTKATLLTYKEKFHQVKLTYKNDSKKLGEENTKLFKELLLDLNN